MAGSRRTVASKGEGLLTMEDERDKEGRVAVATGSVGGRAAEAEVEPKTSLIPKRNPQKKVHSLLTWTPRSPPLLGPPPFVDNPPIEKSANCSSPSLKYLGSGIQ